MAPVEEVPPEEDEAEEVEIKVPKCQMFYYFTDWPNTIEEYQSLSDLGVILNSIFTVNEKFVKEEEEEEEEEAAEGKEEGAPDKQEEEDKKVNFKFEGEEGDEEEGGEEDEGEEGEDDEEGDEEEGEGEEDDEEVEVEKKTEDFDYREEDD